MSHFLNFSQTDLSLEIGLSTNIWDKVLRIWLHSVNLNRLTHWQVSRVQDIQIQWLIRQEQRLMLRVAAVKSLQAKLLKSNLPFECNKWTGLELSCLDWMTWNMKTSPKKMDLPDRRRCSQMPENLCGWRRSRSKSRAGSWTSGSALRSGPCASPPPRSPLRETFCSASDSNTGSFQRLALTELCYPGQSVLPRGNPGNAERGAAACGQCGRRAGAPPARTAAWEPLPLSPAQSGLWGGTVSIKQRHKQPPDLTGWTDWTVCSESQACDSHSHV